MTKNKIALLTTVFRKTGFVEIVDFFLIKLSVTLYLLLKIIFDVICNLKKSHF